MLLIDFGSFSLFVVVVVGMYVIGGFGFGFMVLFILELFVISY